MNLTDVLVGLTLGAWISADAARFGQVALRAIEQQRAMRESRQALVVTSEMFEREWRIAGFHATGEPLDGLSWTETSAIQFSADLNGDGDLADPHETIEYRWDGTRRAVMRATAGSSPQPWLSEVPEGGFVLRYFDTAGQELVTAATRSRAAAVELRLLVQPAAGQVPGQILVAINARRNPPQP